MLLWNGVCTVHDAMQAEAVLNLKAEHPGAPVIAHPECNPALLKVADFVGSTKAMLNYIKASDTRQNAGIAVPLPKRRLLKLARRPAAPVPQSPDEEASPGTTSRWNPAGFSARLSIFREEEDR